MTTEEAQVTEGIEDEMSRCGALSSKAPSSRLDGQRSSLTAQERARTERPSARTERHPL